MIPQSVRPATRIRARNTRLRRVVLVVAMLALFATVTGVGVGAAGSGNNLLRTLGDESFIPNVGVQADLKFSPGTLRIASGEALTIEHADRTEAPHTLTIVGPEEPPSTIEELFEGTGCPTCDAAGFEHVVNGQPVVDGGDGFNAVGDSILFLHGQTAEIDVTAAPGETLSYICIIHPWMQGEIEVT